MDSFYNYLKKQLLEYVEQERKKGIPLEEIKKVLLNAGHKKDIIEEVFEELEKEEAGKKPAKHNQEVEKDLVNMVKQAFKQFMANASEKDIKKAQKDFEKNKGKIVEEVIEEAEIIEEKTILESIAFFIYLCVFALIVVFSAGSSGSEIVNVIIGLSPALISIFASFLMLSLADNVPLYMFIPLGISSLFYVLARFAGITIFKSFEYEALSIVNFIIGFLFNILIVYVRFLKPERMKKKVVKKNKSGLKREIKSANEKAEKKISASSAIDELKKEFNID